ncbi:hypothetical protein [[Flexibacter] sp. ATCC 35208]|uniref:hypothetical protein n=1 Tax=[Flexibacter] sp. ATCC 35208 TaxID=1936242 RepID=UPI0009D0BE29|nr:hypothetical protein [[Flexibacter] sp. ATCC 35208]OMP80079.1 hypothetical protein BW716_06190 [[Flexibacter] sp. ATCC 35208]
MEHEPLHIIEEWVYITIHPQNYLLDLQESNRDLLFLEQKIDMLCNSISDQMHGSVSSFLNVLQLKVLQLLERVGDYVKNNTENLNDGYRSFYIKVAGYLEKVIDYIRRYVPGAFQESLQISCFSFLKNRDVLSVALTQLETAYQHPKIEHPLLRLALQPIKDFVQSDTGNFTFRQLTYIQQLVQSLSFLHEPVPEKWIKDINEEIHTVLLQLNYNLPRYVLLCTTRLDEKMAEMDLAAKLSTLQWYFRTMEQLEPLPGFCFLPTLPNVTEQIVSSLRAAYNLINPVPAEGELKPVHPVIGGRIKLSVSVAVLTLFIKLCIKAGIIVNESKSEVFRITSQTFSTPKSMEVSSGSIRTKHKFSSIHSIKTVRILLLQLVELLKEE